MYPVLEVSLCLTLDKSSRKLTSLATEMLGLITLLSRPCFLEGLERSTSSRKHSFDTNKQTEVKIEKSLVRVQSTADKAPEQPPSNRSLGIY